jgi:dTDP-4-amino-4,6-dideoxygalactose transaminase
MVARRRVLAARYRDSLSAIADVIVPEEPAWARSNWQSYAIRLAPHRDRDEVMRRMLTAGVATRPGVMNAHGEDAYPAESWRAAGDLRNSDLARDRSIILPLYPQMTDEDQQTVVRALESALANP